MATEKPELDAAETLHLATEIVAAFVSYNSVEASKLPALLQDVHDAVRALAMGGTASAGSQEPAVSVKKSITPDYIVCLEDGKKLKMLKRYLRTHYNLSPEEYRRKWGLPADYPMVAPNYAKRRSQFAKDIGLGTSRLGGARKKSTTPRKSAKRRGRTSKKAA